jgi:preprotein translocase SecE subunit
VNLNIAEMVPGLIFGGIVILLLIFNRKRIKEFAVASSAELKKVVWPTKEKVWAQTKLILISLVITAVFFGSVDLLLGKVMAVVFSAS